MIESAFNTGFLLQHDLSYARNTAVHEGSAAITTWSRTGRREGVLSDVEKTKAKVLDLQDSCNYGRNTS